MSDRRSGRQTRVWGIQLRISSRAAALFGHNRLNLSLSPGDAHGHIMVIPPKGEVDLPFSDGKVANTDFVDRGRKDRPTASHPARLRLHRETETRLEQQKD